MNKTRWIGMAKATERVVILVLPKVAQRSLKTEFGASVREIAEDAHLSESTVSRLLTRIRSSGWSRLPNPAKGGALRIWTLHVPRKRANRGTTIKKLRKKGIDYFRAIPHSRGAIRKVKYFWSPPSFTISSDGAKVLNPSRVRSTLCRRYHSTTGRLT